MSLDKEMQEEEFPSVSDSLLNCPINEMTGSMCALKDILSSCNSRDKIAENKMEISSCHWLKYNLS